MATIKVTFTLDRETVRRIDDAALPGQAEEPVLIGHPPGVVGAAAGCELGEGALPQKRVDAHSLFS